MRTHPRSLPRRLFPALAVLALSLPVGDVRAAGPSAAAATFADSGSSSSGGWSFRKLISGITTSRARIVQFCVILMAVALVILCKKLAEVDLNRPALPRRGPDDSPRKPQPERDAGGVS